MFFAPVSYSYTIIPGIAIIAFVIGGCIFEVYFQIRLGIVIRTV